MCSLLSYTAAKTVRLTPALKEGINAFKMNLCRRILKIPWIQIKTNEEILAKMGERKELITDH